MTDIKRIAPIALSIISSVGVIATAILVAKETPEAMTKLDKLKQEKEEVKPIDVVKTVAPTYAPAAIVGFATLASICSGTIISQKSQASLLATCTMLDKGWNKYKGKVKEIFGHETEKKVETEIMRDEYKNLDPVLCETNEQLYWNDHTGYFKANPEKLAYAYGDLNQSLEFNGHCSLYEFLKFADAEILDKDKEKACENLGWCEDYLIYEFEYKWVHFNYEPAPMPDGTEVNNVYFNEPPIVGYYDYDYEDISGRNELFYPKNLEAMKGDSDDVK